MCIGYFLPHESTQVLACMGQSLYKVAGGDTYLYYNTYPERRRKCDIMYAPKLTPSQSLMLACVLTFLVRVLDMNVSVHYSQDTQKGVSGCQYYLLSAIPVPLNY